MGVPTRSCSAGGPTSYSPLLGNWDDPGDSPIWTALNTKPKYVVSTTPPTQWANTTVLSGDLAAAIRELKAKEGGELEVHGSGALVRWLLDNDLVDESTSSPSPWLSARARGCSPNRPGHRARAGRIADGHPQRSDDPGTGPPAARVRDGLGQLKPLTSGLTALTRPRQMRAYVRADRRHDPARRRRLLLCVGRAGTIRRCEAGPSSSGQVSSSPPATKRRPTGFARRWAGHRRSGCAPTRWWSAPGWMPTARRARRYSRYSTTRRRSSKVCRSTRRSSTSEDFG